LGGGGAKGAKKPGKIMPRKRALGRKRGKKRKIRGRGKEVPSYRRKGQVTAGEEKRETRPLLSSEERLS